MAAAAICSDETKSMPLWTEVLTWSDTCALISGLSWMFETKLLVSPDRTTAPMSATPSDEPSCWPVNWRPPASPRPETSTEACTTLPSWEARKPMPTPSSAIDSAKAASLRVGWIVPRSTMMAASVIHRPERTMARTEKRLARRAPSAEATNMVMETGSILMPVSRASRPRTSCR